MLFQNDSIGFLQKKHFDDPEKAFMVTNAITSIFGGIQPRTVLEGTRVILQTLSALKSNVSPFPKLLKVVAKGYKLIQPSISKVNQSWDEINMQLMGRGRDKNLLEQVLGSLDVTDDEISILSDYDSMEELITESSQFIKDKPIQQFIHDTYKFKLERIYNEKGPKKDMIPFLPQYDDSKVNKQTLEIPNKKPTYNITSHEFLKKLPFIIKKLFRKILIINSMILYSNMTSTIRLRILKRKFIHPSGRKVWSIRGT